MKRTDQNSSERAGTADRGRRRSLRADGQTMVELLVVISIILILMAILLPALRRSIQQATSTVCMANLREVHQALQIYRLDNAGWLPVSDHDQEPQLTRDVGLMSAWYRSLFPRYVGDLTVLVCPADPLADAVRESLSLAAVVQDLPELTSYGLNEIILTSEDQYLAHVDRYPPRRPWDTLLVADLGADVAPTGTADYEAMLWIESVRNHGQLPIDDGYDPGRSVQVPPWLTGRHSGGINMVTFGGAIRSIRTESLMTEPISAYYEDCALGGCTVCNQLALPHYNLSAAGTYWWTGTLPRR
ncbi:MAG: prepilin-type N-terminal cleavage/methylation domain-containing protein [Planctomycetes bacterium]|nr:prepilin-type N-terminal cleavage/methylation domain-containing protein [Planctomycetota bacterium]